MNGPLDAAPASASDGPPPSAPGGGDTSRSCLEVTLRHISDAVIVSDGQGLVTLMNPLAEALTGWSGFEASGQRLAHVFPVVSDLTGEPLCLAPTRPDEAAPDWTPVQLIDRQGRRHAVSVRCADIPGTAGQAQPGVVLIVRGEAADRAPQRSTSSPQARYRALVENSPVGIFHFGTDLRITYSNKRLAEILGASPEAIQGVDLHTLDDMSILSILQGALGGQRGAYDGPFALPLSPEVHLLSIHVAPERDAAGQIYGGVGIVEDRAAFQSTDEQRRDAKERYVLSQRSANEGLWDWDPNTQLLYLSPRLLALLGLHSDTLKTTGAEWLKLIHPDDRKRYRADVIAHLRGQTEHFESVYRVAD